MFDYSISHHANHAADRSRPYPDTLLQTLSQEASDRAYSEISSWPGYAQTRLHDLAGIARTARVERIWYKDEGSRFGLGSFKSLGGAYAVFTQIRSHLKERTGEEVSIGDLLERRYPELVDEVEVTCATAGNHGRSVAWGAQLFGCHCVIYLHRAVSAGREQAIASYGADIVRVDGTYDDSARQAAADAIEHGRTLVTDTGHGGYFEIPRTVAHGYTVMMREILSQLNGEQPTHLFVQAGVGGLVGAACGYSWLAWGRQRPRAIAVEPEQANCLQESARQGRPVVVPGELETLMACLACGEVSEATWDLVYAACDDFITIEEAAIAPIMRLLADGDFRDPAIVAGESGAAGLAAALAACSSPGYRELLGLDDSSKILAIGTEGATDPELYQRLLDRARRCAPP